MPILPAQSTPLMSYAQNQEDVMLWRALKHIETGFYIDVGAADPVDLSVTQLFYLRGWTGINIEPADFFFERLSAERVRDVNLRLVLGDRIADRTFYRVNDSGLSTLEENVAEKCRREGFAVAEITVAGSTLAQVCSDFRADGPIHFLKIDAEGSEGEVLRGADFQRFRPWIALLEATEPGSDLASYSDWEPGLLRDGYECVWFDGLNRFYLAEEHAQDLRSSFRVPPNIFDGFIRAADLFSRAEAADHYARNEAEARRTAEDRAEAADHYARNEAEARRTAEDRAEAADHYARSEAEARRTAEAALQIAEHRRGDAEERAMIARRWGESLEQLLDLQRTRADTEERRAAQLLAAQDILRAEHAAEVAQLLSKIVDSAEQAGRRIGAALLQAETANREKLEAQRQFHHKEEEFRVAAARAEGAEHAVRLFQASNSWRITRPLRGLVYLARGKVGLGDALRLALKSRSAVTSPRGAAPPPGERPSDLTGVQQQPSPSADSPGVTSRPHPASPDHSATGPSIGHPEAEIELTYDEDRIYRVLSHKTTGRR